MRRVSSSKEACAEACAHMFSKAVLRSEWLLAPVNITLAAESEKNKTGAKRG